MRRSFAARLVLVAMGAALLGASALPAPPPPPAVRPVTETHFGVTVSDPYRYFEDPKDPGLAAYFRSQNTYTRSILDALPGRAALAARIAQLDNATEQLSDVQPAGATYFYLKRPPDANTTRLYARAIAGGRERMLLDPDRFARSRTQHFSFDYFSPSPTGRYVAVGTSEGGSERTVLRVLDARTGVLLPDVIERALYVPPSWRDDGRSFYYFRTPRAAPNAPQSEKDTRGVVRLHVLGRDPDRDPAVFGYGVRPDIPFAPEDASAISVSARTPWAIAAVIHGVQNEIGVYVAPASTVTSAHAPWRRIATYADDVVGAVAAGDTLYLTSHANAPRRRLLALDAARRNAGTRARGGGGIVARHRGRLAGRRRHLPARPRRRALAFAPSVVARRRHAGRDRRHRAAVHRRDGLDRHRPRGARRGVRADLVDGVAALVPYRARTRRTGHAAAPRVHRSTTRRSRHARCSRRAPTGRACRSRS